MNAAERARRNDFMTGHGKAHSKDALTRQKAPDRRKLTHTDLLDLYASSRIIQNIIDIPAEDMTKNWINIKMEDETLRKALMDKLRDLKARQAFMDMRRYERLHGDGFISIGAVESQDFELSDPLLPERLKRIDYLHAFSKRKVSNFYPNEDMFSPTYGEVEFFQMNRLSRVGEQIAGQSIQDRVHRSRLFHDQTRRLEDEYEGQSLLESMYDVLTVFDTSLWSVGQILYDFTFKKYNTDAVNGMSKEEKQETAMLVDFMFRTEGMAMLGKDEELSKESTSVQGIDQLLSFVWEVLAGEARMPKSVIKGQESGTITGAQYDVLNYYMRISSQQENELRPMIEQLVRLLLWCDDELGGRIDPESIDWEVTFNPIWDVDKKTDAEIRKIMAEVDEKYILTQVLTSDEIRDLRFGKTGLSSLTDLTNDSMADIKEWLDKVKRDAEEG